MMIIISDRADLQLKRTALYIQAEFGNKYRIQFITNYRHVLQLLRKNPRIGPTEPLLEHLVGEYRSVVLGYVNKIVYRIHDKTIEILDIWDTRRDPSALASEIS